MSKAEIDNPDKIVLPWTPADIPYDSIDIKRIHGDKVLFYLLTSASFVESAASVYAENLCRYYADHPDVASWLNTHWKHEEMQHGRALRCYIEKVWPEFDWERGYRAFFDEYSAVCSMDELEPTQTLEMVARCVVETGTSSLYRAIGSATDEPVLQALAGKISNDEVRHYKYFYRYYNTCRTVEKTGRWRIFKAISKRLSEIKDEDSEIALRHVLRVERGVDTVDPAEVKSINTRVGTIVRANFPIDMASKMLIRPLDLNPRLERLIRRPLVALVKRMLPS